MVTRRLFGEGATTPVSRRPAPGFSAGGFVACPAPLQPWAVHPGAWALEIYQLAYRQAEASLTPSLLERLATPSPN